MADETSNPRYLAADILARCEHGSDSAGVVVTTSQEIAEQTLAEVERQAPLLSRQKYVQDALSLYSAIIVVDSFEGTDDALTLTWRAGDIAITRAIMFLMRCFISCNSSSRSDSARSDS